MHHRRCTETPQGWLIAGNVSSLPSPSGHKALSRSTKWLDQVNPSPPPSCWNWPLSLTRNLINSANFSIRFQDFQAEKGARKGDRSFFALVTPAPRPQALRLSSGINFHLGKLCPPSPSPREKISFSTEPPRLSSLDFSSTPRKIPSRFFLTPNFFPTMEKSRN